MSTILLILIYIAFISLGLPDGLEVLPGPLCMSNYLFPFLMLVLFL